MIFGGFFFCNFHSALPNSTSVFSPIIVGLPIIISALFKFKAPIHIGFLSGLDLDSKHSDHLARLNCYLPYCTVLYLSYVHFLFFCPSCTTSCKLVILLHELRSCNSTNELERGKVKGSAIGLCFFTQSLPLFPFHHAPRH